MAEHDIAMHPEGRWTSIVMMQDVDGLLPEWRALVHQYGYGVYRLWLKGWTTSEVETRVRPDGVLTTDPRFYHLACREVRLRRPPRPRSTSLPQSIEARHGR